MIRYNTSLRGDAGATAHDWRVDAYRNGVDRVRKYIESINAYPKLVAELKWAIDEGII